VYYSFLFKRNYTLTTTIFRKNNGVALMASDSRVSWVNKITNLPVRWFDSKDYLKTITLDGVLYGFAGTNVMFKMFMQGYKTKEESVHWLDTLVESAKQNNCEFYMIRYGDSELQLFAYSPPKTNQNNTEEIYLISKDPIINKSFFAIGSGKHSKEFKKYRLNSSAQLPIKKIIEANMAGFKKEGVLELLHKVTKSMLTTEESDKAFFACHGSGGDIFTGGVVNMSKSANTQQLENQIKIMDDMDSHAKANGAVCASPVNASLEIAQLNKMGHYAVSPHTIDQSAERTALLNQMRDTFNASV